MFEKEEVEDYTTKHGNMKYSIGQEVIVVDDGKCYSTYYDWVSDNKLCLSNDKLRRLWVKYLDGCNDCEKGTELTVVACGTHGNNSNIAMYLCEDFCGNPVLISEPGLDILVEKTSLRWTDLKIGDVIQNKMYGFQLMITGIKSDYTLQHIYIGTNWITDSELAEQWEKVEELP